MPALTLTKKILGEQVKLHFYWDKEIESLKIVWIYDDGDRREMDHLLSRENWNPMKYRTSIIKLFQLFAMNLSEKEIKKIHDICI